MQLVELLAQDMQLRQAIVGAQQALQVALHGIRPLRALAACRCCMLCLTNPSEAKPCEPLPEPLPNRYDT